jgi:hypothetical protein
MSPTGSGTAEALAAPVGVAGLPDVGRGPGSEAPVAAAAPPPSQAASVPLSRMSAPAAAVRITGRVRPALGPRAPPGPSADDDIITPCIGDLTLCVHVVVGKQRRAGRQRVKMSLMGVVVALWAAEGSR